MTKLFCIALACTLALALTGCNKPGPVASDNKASPVLQIAPSDLLRVETGSRVGGPVVTGTLQPGRRADLRAEVSAVVLQVFKDNGDAVRRGDTLVRLDDTTLRDVLASARDGLRTATQALEQAQRQLTRTRTLRESGMASTQQFEDAEVQVTNRASDLSAAKAREVQAAQQLDKTVVRAPFDGLIAARKVSVGDTASVGKELLQVVDPASVRLEGLIAADAAGQLRVGQRAQVRISGLGDTAQTGTLTRISPVASPSTRQTEVQISLTQLPSATLTGRFAEGNIETAAVAAIRVPRSSVVSDGDVRYVWTFDGKAVHKQTLPDAQRDPRSGDYWVTQGLQAGTQILRSPMGAIKDGQSAQAAQSTASAVTPPASTAR